MKILAPALAALLGISVLKASYVTASANTNFQGAGSQEEIHESVQAQIHEHEGENKRPSESHEPSVSPSPSVSLSATPSSSPSPSESPSPTPSPTVFVGVNGQANISLQNLINMIVNFLKSLRG